jgi:hypothetical protein
MDSFFKVGANLIAGLLLVAMFLAAFGVATLAFKFLLWSALR